MCFAADANNIPKDAKILVKPSQDDLLKEIQHILQSKQEIKFYEKGQLYFQFTNFYEAPIVIDGEIWKTSEHYFQAQKFPAHPGLQFAQLRVYVDRIMKEIQQARSAREAFDMSRKYNDYKRVDWEAAKDNIMVRAGEELNDRSDLFSI